MPKFLNKIFAKSKRSTRDISPEASSSKLGSSYESRDTSDGKGENPRKHEDNFDFDVVCKYLAEAPLRETELETLLRSLCSRMTKETLECFFEETYKTKETHKKENHISIFDSVSSLFSKSKGISQSRSPRVTPVVGIENEHDEVADMISLTEASALLKKVFPAHTLPTLTSDVGGEISGNHSSVSVFFSDIMGFTEWSATVPPSTIIDCLSAYFQILDDLAERHGVYKVETIGDAWMAVCGAPKARSDHAQAMAIFALQVIETVEDLRAIFGSPKLNIRVGIHSGSVVSGIVRADRPRWQLFGDTVNMASRMESTGVPGHIQISQETQRLLEPETQLPDTMKFDIQPRGLVQVKGKGIVPTYFLKAMGDAAARVSHSIGPRLTFISSCSDQTIEDLDFHESDHELNLENNVRMMDCIQGSRGSRLNSREYRNSFEMGATEDVFGDYVETSAGSYESGISKRPSTNHGLPKVRSPEFPSEILRRNRYHSMSDELMSARIEAANSEEARNLLQSQSLQSIPSQDFRRILKRSSAAVNSKAKPSRLVLLCDDTASTLMQYQRLLSNAGSHVVIAHTFQEGIMSMRKTEFDAVFIDVNMKSMPSISSISMFRDWETAYRSRRQMIVGLISNPSAGDKEALMKVGFDHVENKTNSKETIQQYII